MLYIWIVVLVLAAIGELITQELISVWFILGALVSIILALCHVEIWIQIVSFGVISLICLFLLRTVASKMLNKKKVATNLDLIIGDKSVLTKAVTENENGELSREGIVWTAVSENGEPIEKGEKVVITAIKGNKLIVRKGE